jgi:hypothetical protein
VENNTNSWNERTATVTAPAGALSYEIVISGGTGREFWVDDIVVAEQTFANKLLFLPELSYQDSDSTRRILSAKKELYAPQAPVIALVATASGNCTNGAHLCKVTFTDSSGETEASSASNSVTVDASNKQITCSLEVGPWGTTARNIYMTEAGGSTYKLVGTQADNTTTSYTINVPDGNLTTDAPMVNLSGSRNIYPGSFIVPCAGATSNATTSISYSSGNGLPAITQAGGAFANNGDWFLFPEISCMSGTYTIILFGIKGSDRGKVDLYLDNTLISSGHDLYNAGPIDGSFTTTGVTISGSGVHVFKAVVNGKNGSSTDYLTPMNSIIGRRTGD